MRLLLIGTAALSACGEPCLQLPCPAPIAIQATVTSKASGAALPATVDVVRPDGRSFTQTCQVGLCGVDGGPGKYHIRINSTGFVPFESDFNIAGSEAKPCNSCTTADTQVVSVALTPAG